VQHLSRSSVLRRVSRQRSELRRTSCSGARRLVWMWTASQNGTLSHQETDGQGHRQDFK